MYFHLKAPSSGLDVNSDVNSQPFSINVVLQATSPGSKDINEISVKFDWVFLKVIHCGNFVILQAPSAGIKAACKFGKV